VNKDLMAEYGELMVQKEILDGRILDCKQRIVAEMQPKRPVEVKPEPPVV
jgi:hypothetical protein